MVPLLPTTQTSCRPLWQTALRTVLVGHGLCNTFRAQGWGFDLRNRRLLKHVTVMLDDRPLAETRYGGARKDVADYFHIPEVEASGWEVNKDLSGWPRRCYNMSLQLTRANDSIWRSPTQARVCLR